jgi:hypothetical protein
MSVPRRVVQRPKALNCPNCGSAIELRAMGAAATVVCSYCSTTLDATDPQLKILQRWQGKMTVQPLIPLGSRGKLAGTIWEAIGFQQRCITVEGVQYCWREYVLFNPYKGFRYLSEYDNHWSFVTPMQSLPEPGSTMIGRPTMKLGDVTYNHFQTARAVTGFVIGEFPWQVKVGETVGVADYVAPPQMLSAETTENEVSWSRGEYLDGKDIWSAFQLPGAPPAPRGIYSIQPAPVEAQRGRPWLLFFLFSLLMIGMMIGFAAKARSEKVFEETFTFNPAATGEKSFVTQPFELKGDSANLQVEVKGELINQWAYLSMALINEQTGQAFDFGRQISYYYGVDGGETWTEDSREDEATLPAIPGGRYYLRIEPETEAPAAGTIAATTPIRYTIKLTRDVPYYFRYLLGVFLLLLPLPFMGRKGSSFEAKRWEESDYGVPPSAGMGHAASASHGDDDDE